MRQWSVFLVAGFALSSLTACEIFSSSSGETSEVDCDDPTTADDSCPESCVDSIDNDDDGDIDCADSDCATSSACPDMPLPVPGPGSSVSITGALVESDPTWDRPSENCAPGDADEHFYDTFTVENATGQTQSVEIAARWDDPRTDGFLHVYDGEDFDPFDRSNCLLGNDNDTSDADSRLAFDMDDGQVVTVVASTFTRGRTTLWEATITTVVPGEICGDEVDNDLNGAADCDDPFCVGHPTCLESVPLAEVGQSLTFSGSVDSTDASWDRLSGTCQENGGELEVFFYDIWQVTNELGVEATVDFIVTWEDDGFLHIFNVPFDDDTNAKYNLQDEPPTCWADDDLVTGDTSQSGILDFVVAPDETITIVLSSFMMDVPAGPYTLEVTTK